MVSDINLWKYILFIISVSVFNLGEIRLVNVVANVLGDVFPELKQQEVHIRNVIQEEEESFGRTLVKVRIDTFEDIFMGCHILVPWHNDSHLSYFLKGLKE